MFVYSPSDKFIVGVPDLIACVHGKFVAIELKRPDKQSTTHAKLQLYILDKIKRAGGIAFRSSSYDEVIAAISTLYYVPDK